MALLGPVATFFLLFAAPSALLALLALRDFLLRGPGGAGDPRVRRARLLQVLAASVAAALVVLTTALTGGAPLSGPGGWVFLGWGLAAGALGPLGAWLFARAAADPRRRNVKAAETAPLVLVMLDLVLVANAAMQLP